MQILWMCFIGLVAGALAGFLGRAPRWSRQLIVLLLAAGALHSQERPNGFYFTTPLRIGVGVDDGFVVGESTFRDTVAIVSPQVMSWLRTTHRTRLTIGYEPEFELFQHNDEFRAWNHAGHVRVLHQVNSRFSVDAGDSFLSTMDGSRALNNSLLLLPRGRFVQNSLYADVGYRYDLKTKLSVRFDNTLTTMDAPGELGQRLDQTTSGITTKVEREINPRHNISGSYSLLRAHPFHPEVAGEPANVHLGMAGYTWDLNRGLSLHFTGGALRSAETALMGSVALQKRLGQAWVTVGYQRYIPFFGSVFPFVATSGAAQFAQGLTPASIYQVASLRIRGRITPRFGIDMSAQRALNGLDRQQRDIRSAFAQLHLSYRIVNRVSLFTRLDYYNQNINEFFDFPMKRKRYLAGIEIALFSPPVEERPPNEPEDVKQVIRGIGATQANQTDRSVGIDQQQQRQDKKK